MPSLLFYILSAVMLLLGVMVITARNAIYAAMGLVMLLGAMAGLFVLLGAYFLAAVQVLVYAGAIMVLFLFVIMFLDVSAEEKRTIHWFGAINGILVFLGMAGEFYLLAMRNPSATAGAGGNLMGTTEAVGRLLFSQYLVPFEVASVLLLAAMIGAIVLGRKEEGT